MNPENAAQNTNSEGIGPSTMRTAGFSTAPDKNNNNKNDIIF
jgi:hypothetical protein